MLVLRREEVRAGPAGAGRGAGQDAVLSHVHEVQEVRQPPGPPLQHRTGKSLGRTGMKKTTFD